jgi:Zn-dependent protease
MQRSAFRLFKVAGIQVYLHYAWFIVAAWEAMVLAGRYNSPIWGLFECLPFSDRPAARIRPRLCLPAGRPGRSHHLMAARRHRLCQSASEAWCLSLESCGRTACKCRVIPHFFFFLFVASNARWNLSDPDLFKFIAALGYMNTVLLIFTLLPVYPLDGGQIVRALLWFFIGPVRSLKVASVIGIGGAIVFALIAYQAGSFYLGLLAFFVFVQAQAGWRQAQALTREAEARARVTPPPVPPAP